MKIWLILALVCGGKGIALAQTKPARDRVASISISESFINEQLKTYSAKSALFRHLRIHLDPNNDNMYLLGDLQIPLEELQTVRLDSRLGLFKFQLTIKPRATSHGHLMLEFPLSETYIYQADSKNPKRDRVVIPVQLLSLALASVRGYLSALSGDFSIFDRKAAKLSSLLKDARKSIAGEQNADALLDLRNQEKSLDLQLQEMTLQRAELERAGKSLSKVLGFTGEKELNINDEIEARDNALLLKIKLGQVVPYLKDIELSGVRIRHDKKDGSGEDYLVVDVTSPLATEVATAGERKRNPRAAMKIPPALQIRLNEKVLSTKTVVEAEKNKLSSDIREFNVTLQDDGVHVIGTYHKLFLNIPFDTIVDFASTAPDVFDVKLRELSVWGLDLKFLTSFALDAIKERLDKALAGICTFEYLGEKDSSKVLRVTVEPKKLIPAFPDLHLVDVDVAQREFILRVGRIN